ncbi:primase-like DNA-binding domain-containing protein [Sphingobium limneticum]|uniref:primase-like DNA-binding domain-containing protein n=1 Tax=Sphingobium limneticum TaxID=1007511 RepID=UPI003CFE8109
MDDLGNLKRFVAHLGDNSLPVGAIDWSRVRVIAWFDPAPAADLTSVPQVRAERDPLGLFLNDCVQPADGATVQSSELYEAFVQWCRVNGRSEWSHKGFSRAMSDAGYEKVVRDGVRWVGLSLQLPKMDGVQ